MNGDDDHETPDLITDLAVEAMLARGIDPSDLGASKIAEIINEVTLSSASGLARELERAGPEMLEHRRQDAREFRERLHARWGLALDHLEMLHVAFLEFGERWDLDHNNSREGHRLASLELVTRLHVRACSVSNEVIELLAAGFAAGAQARWRTLHEIAVTLVLICEHGNDLAERYFAHGAVDAYKTAKINHEHGYTDDAELEEARASCAAQVARYGPAFGKPNGWAASIVDDPATAIHFQTLEEKSGISGLRPYYRLSGHSVHAGATGVHWQQNVVALHDDDPPIACGPTDAGLGDPAECAANTLVMIAASMMASRPTGDHLLMVRALCELRDRTVELFGEAETRYERGLDAERSSTSEKA